MAESEQSDKVFWVDPRFRGIINLDAVHISRSLRALMRKSTYDITLNNDFLGVINGCADRDETWISEDIKKVYHQLHLRGVAHSLEVYQEKKLIGGIYGVAFGGVFFAESMFSRVSSASKLALIHLCDHLNICGFKLFDTQFITPHLASMGGEEITRQEFQELLKTALEITPLDIAQRPLASTYEVLQRNGQTS